MSALISQYKDDNWTTKLISSIPKSSSITGKSAAQITFQYRTHVTGRPTEGHGWLSWYILGTPVGTTGED